ncbi:hypothetical protein SGPA1_31501 [Streptomyces misionensis JCM 4497]
MNSSPCSPPWPAAWSSTPGRPASPWPPPSTTAAPTRPAPRRRRRWAVRRSSAGCARSPTRTPRRPCCRPSCGTTTRSASPGGSRESWSGRNRGGPGGRPLPHDRRTRRPGQPADPRRAARRGRRHRRTAPAGPLDLLPGRGAAGGLRLGGGVARIHRAPGRAGAVRPAGRAACRDRLLPHPGRGGRGHRQAVPVPCRPRPLAGRHRHRPARGLRRGMAGRKAAHRRARRPRGQPAGPGLLRPAGLGAGPGEPAGRGGPPPLPAVRRAAVGMTSGM